MAFSFLSFFKVTEDFVQKVFIDVVNEEKVIASDIDKALRWIAGNSSVIEADLAKVQEIVTALGLTSDPAVGASVAAASVAAEEFIKFAQAYSSGKSTPETVAVGYQAYTQTKAAVASALAAATVKK